MWKTEVRSEARERFLRDNWDCCERGHSLFSLSQRSNRAAAGDQDDVQYSSVDFQRSGPSRNAGPPGAEAAGGAEDDGQHSTNQPHCSRETSVSFLLFIVETIVTVPS